MKQTKTKQDRTLWYVKKFGKDGQPEVLGGRAGHRPPEPPERIEVEYRGEKFSVFRSKGQIINPRKEWKRQLAKRGYGTT